jgi:quinol monooxygenase YgiN
MFEATARLKIRDGELDGFKRQVAEIVRLTRERDTKPLRYDWFLSDDGTECEVREAYVDADALLEQQQQVAEAKMRLFRGFVDDHHMTFYGELSPALAGALEAMGTKFTQFSFFQGLEADVEVLDEVATMFEVTARLKVRDGELEGFERQVAEIMRLTRERDTKTLRYDWFLSDDGTQCEVREAYVDADGLLEHHFHIAEAKAELFRDFAYDHDMTFYGEPSPALAEALEGMAGAVQITQFSFFQGLDARVLDEVPA